jgi:hypothetical protein
MTIAVGSLAWRTSSYSSDGEHCVEVAHATSILIRDTKCRSAGLISVPRNAWTYLIRQVASTL